MDAAFTAPGVDLLVVGYGSTLRTDDAAGRRVAQAVQELNLPDVSVLICDLLTPEVADPISKAARVIFVDASVDGTKSVQLRPLAPADSSQLLAHAADPQTMLALARDLFGHAPPAWWLTVPAENMEIGEGLSLKATQGVAEALQLITELLVK